MDIDNSMSLLDWMVSLHSYMDWGYMDLLIRILSRYRVLGIDNSKLRFDSMVSHRLNMDLAYMDL